MTNNHIKPAKPSDVDLTGDPGLGRSRGIGSPVEEEALQGESTIEGDIANDTTPEGGVNPGQRGRTNS